MAGIEQTNVHSQPLDLESSALPLRHRPPRLGMVGVLIWGYKYLHVFMYMFVPTYILEGATVGANRWKLLASCSRILWGENFQFYSYIHVLYVHTIH